MNQVQYSTGSFRISRERTTHTPQQRLFGLAFAVAMEASIVYALLVTLGYVEAPKITPPLTIVNVAPLPANPDLPPPPPQTFEPPRVETVITPVVDLTYTPPTPTTAISLPPALPVPPAPRVETPPTPPVVFTPARAIASSHTIPEYPFVSRRLREQGTLRLKLTVDEKGLVTQAVVVNSSGFQRLDEAALKWVKAQWRYTPAMQGTKPIPSMADAIVEFRLQ
jgi:periplasmic protein TonB